MTVAVRAVPNAQGVSVATNIVGIAVRDPSNVLVQLKGGAVRDHEGLLRDFFGSLGSAPSGESGSITVDPPQVSGFINSLLPATVRTGRTVAAVVGAVGNPSFAWELVDSDLGTWEILSPLMAETAFERTEVDPSTTGTATFRCLVTVDGQSAYSPIVSATVTNVRSAP